MKLEEVVSQLRALLPQLTDKLTTNVDVLSLTRNGSTMTAKCLDAHDLDVGDFVAITGADVRIPVNLTRDGTTGTCSTSVVHDLTKKANKSLSITFSGATEAEFNGPFDVIQIVNGNTITFTMPDSGATAASGSPVLHEAAGPLQNYNTTVEVTSTASPVDFTYEQTDTTIPDPSGSIVARSKPRIGALSSATEVIRIYSEQPADDYWLFVVPEGVEASKDRSELSDATSNHSRGTEYIQQLVERLTVFVVIPATDDLGGSLAADAARDLFRPIARSLLFSNFDSGLANGTHGGAVQFERHTFVDYNGATYVHAYEFSRQYDLTYDDTVGDDLNVAFRDLCFDMFPIVPGGTGLGSYPSVIDLADVELPIDTTAWQGYANDTFETYFQSEGDKLLGVANQWSIATWVKRNTLSTNFMLFAFGNRPTPDFWQNRIQCDSNGTDGFSVVLQDKDNAAANGVQKRYNIRDLFFGSPVRDWEQFVFTFDGVANEFVIYFNGAALPLSVQGGSGDPWVDILEDDNVDMIDVARHITIGSDVDNGNEFGRSWRGAIYDWALWSTVKTPAQVAATYNAGIPIDQRFTAGALEHYFRFDDPTSRGLDLGFATDLLDITTEEELDGGSHTFFTVDIDNFPGA